MELNQLRYFQVVAKHQHMTRAANELHISQSSLSKTIAALEADLGTQLFDRIGGRIVLNPVGQQFLRRIDRSLLEMDDAVREANGVDFGYVTFATGNTSICASYMYQFIRQHPGIRLRHYPMPYPRVREALEQGEIDFALMYDTILSDQIQWEPIAQEEVYLLVSRRHPMAAQEFTNLSQFQNDLFIFSNSDFGIAEAGSAFCQQAGFEPKLLFEGDAPKMSLRLVGDGCGVMFMSAYEYMWHTEPEMIDPLFHSVRALRIADPICRRTIGLASLRNRYVSPSAQIFVDGLRLFFCQVPPETPCAP